MQIQIEKLNLLEDGLDGRLDRAFSDHEAINPQYGANWLLNLTSHALDTHYKAVIYVARASEDDFIAVPLKLNSKNSQAQSLSTFYTSAYSPIVCSETPDVLFQALFQHLAKVEKISTLALAPMDVSSPVFSLIQRALAQAGWRGCHAFFCFGNWIHTLQDGVYESYLATRPSSLRNTIARKTRKFLASEKGRLEIVQSGDSLERAIAQFVAVYNNSWKVAEPYPDFIPALLRLAADQGWLRLGIAHYDNTAVASQIWLVCNGTAYIFKLAYDEDYKRLSAGTVLTACMMKSVIEEDHVVKIDYLSGDDAYKADWMSQRKEQHGIAAFNPRSAEGLTLLIGQKLKDLLKTMLRRPSGYAQNKRGQCTDD
jgi:Acetyltransferase (GNAT) domain